MKFFFKILIFSFLFSTGSLTAQYNPYLRKKNKNKPSVKMSRQNKKEISRQNRIAKRQMRKSRRRVKR